MQGRQCGGANAGVTLWRQHCRGNSLSHPSYFASQPGFQRIDKPHVHSPPDHRPHQLALIRRSVSAHSPFYLQQGEGGWLRPI
jgi:hypothetical protein